MISDLLAYSPYADSSIAPGIHIVVGDQWTKIHRTTTDLLYSSAARNNETLEEAMWSSIETGIGWYSAKTKPAHADVLVQQGRWVYRYRINGRYTIKALGLPADFPEEEVHEEVNRIMEKINSEIERDLAPTPIAKTGKHGDIAYFVSDGQRNQSHRVPAHACVAIAHAMDVSGLHSVPEFFRKSIGRYVANTTKKYGPLAELETPSIRE